MTADHAGDLRDPVWRVPDGPGREAGIGIVGCRGIVSRGTRQPAAERACAGWQ